MRNQGFLRFRTVSWEITDESHPPRKFRLRAVARQVGTASIAYVAHKAASPLRFPPTVALTPYVAKTLFGKDDSQ